MIWIYTSETAFIYINSSDDQKSLKSRHYSRSPDEETVAQSGLVTSSRPHSSVAELKLRSNFPVLSLKTPCLFFPGYFCSILELKRWSEEVLSWKITFVEWFIVFKVHSYQRFNKWSFPPAQIQHSIIFFCKFLFGRKRNFFFLTPPRNKLKGHAWRDGAEVPWWECSGLEGKPPKRSWAPELWVPHMGWSLWSSCDLQSATLASCFTGSSFPLGGRGLCLPHYDSDG